ncbi:MAG: DUF4783 domain-containing protein [Bacteroidales bacterium]|jgi:hypothetical protein|nr:DUF4783 domain-containing protein [Bacteroidales bacterium]
MNYLLIILIFTLSIFSAKAEPIDTSMTQQINSEINQDNIIDNIAAAINSGDAKKLASYFNASIDLTVPGSEGTFSKSQSEMIVKNFFSHYPPLSFVVNQKGSSTEGSLFAIGKLTTKSTTFRTYFLVKKTNNILLIHQLQFEEE